MWLEALFKGRRVDDIMSADLPKRDGFGSFVGRHVEAHWHQFVNMLRNGFQHWVKER